MNRLDLNPSRWMPFLVALATALALSAAIQALGIQKYASGVADDRLFTAAKPLNPAQRIVVVLIGSRSDAPEWSTPTPFWSEPLEKVIRNVDACEPKVLGLDLILATDIDDYLAKRKLASTGMVNRLFDTIKGPLVDHRLYLARFTNAQEAQDGAWIPMLGELASQAGAEAFIDLIPADGVTREMPLQDGPLPSMGFALASRARGVDPGEPGAANLIRPEGKTFWLDYRYTDFKVVNSSALLHEPSQATRQLLQGAIILVGSSQFDKKPLPSGKTTDGVFIHAIAVASLLAQTPLHRAGPDSVLLYTLISVLALWWVSMPIGIAGLALSSVGIWVFARSMLESHSVLVPTAPALLGLGSAAIATFTVRAVIDSKRRQYVERIFGQHVSNEIRDLLLTNKANIRLGGTRNYASILFVDLRGSVELAFNRDPQEVIRELNDLFKVMVPAIQENRGILSRYTGDGFVAVFGAPVELANHAQAAVDAGKSILRRLETFNRERPGKELRIGSGINTGNIVCGNIGTEDRSEFTVIGDTVNLAARIESFTKETCSDLIISDTTLQQLIDRTGVGAPIKTQFKGREGAETTVYSVDFHDKGERK